MSVRPIDRSVWVSAALGTAALLLTSCGSERSVGAIAPGETIARTSSADPSVSLLFRDNPREVEALDAALALAAFNLPTSLQKDEAAIVTAANQLLGSNFTPEDINPTPSAASLDFARPSGLALVDSALLLASSRLSEADRANVPSVIAAVKALLGEDFEFDANVIGNLPGVESEPIVVSGNCPLVAAISAANADVAVQGCPAGVGPDTIVLTGDIALDEVNNTLIGPTGLPAITSEITIAGNGHAIERVDTAPEFRLFLVEGGGGLTLNDVTLRGGSVPSDGRFAANDGEDGGAIYVRQAGRLIVSNGTRITGNQAFEGGGGIFASGDADEIIVRGTNTSVDNNSSNYGGGVAVPRIGASVGDIPLRVEGGAEIANNTATREGGGIFAARKVILENAVISGNEAGRDGGGLFQQRNGVILTPAGVPNITIFSEVRAGTQILNNTTEGVGGGISVDNLGALRIIGPDIEISGNVAARNGGGVNSIGTLDRISGATFADNEASLGGGLYVVDDLNVSDAAFINNLAEFGGGLHTVGTDGAATEVTDTRFLNNRLKTDANEDSTGSALFTRTGELVVTQSCFVNNEGVAAANDSSDAASAIENWWGEALGPRPNIGSGDVVDGNFNVLPVLSAPILGCPTRN